MLNIEMLIYELLVKTFPGKDIAPELDVNAIAQYPLITYSVSGGNSLNGGNGLPPTAWDVVLNVSLFEDDIDKANDLATALYEGIWSWGNAYTTAGHIGGLGHVAEIDDQSVFTRVSTAIINDRSITHMAGSFTLQAHQL